MNIKKALKKKNKLVKLNSENYQHFRSFNSTIEGTERPYEPLESMDSWLKGVDELLELKTRIHLANAPVYYKIFRLGELKSVVKQLRGVWCESGKNPQENYTRVAALSFVERDKLVQKYEAEIERLQEELDEHNARTDI